MLVGVCFHRCWSVFPLLSFARFTQPSSGSDSDVSEGTNPLLPAPLLSLGNAYHFGVVNNHAFPSHPPAQLLPNSDYPSLHLPPHAALYTSCESISLNQDINGKLPLLLTPVGFATPASDWVDPSDACTIPCLVLSSHLPSVDLRLRNGTEWRGIKRPDMKAGSLSLARRLPEHEPKGSGAKGDAVGRDVCGRPANTANPTANKAGSPGLLPNAAKF